MSDNETALRIYVASRGLVGRLARLLENAGTAAVQEHAAGTKSVLTLERLASAFEISAIDKEAPNPFRVPNPLELLTRNANLNRQLVGAQQGRRHARRANPDAHFRP